MRPRNRHIINLEYSVTYEDVPSGLVSVTIAYGGDSHAVMVDIDGYTVKHLIRTKDTRLFVVLDEIWVDALKALELEREQHQVAVDTMERGGDRDRALEQRTAAGFVYLIKADMYYKIGMTKNPEARALQVASGLPYPSRLIHAIPASNMADAEATLHQQYAHCRVNGEWFLLSDVEEREILSIERM